MVRKMCGQIERFAPLFISISIAVAFGFFGDQVLAAASKSSLEIEEAFGLSFDFSTFFCGTLFGVYVFLLGPSATFVQKIFATQTFAIFSSYVSIAIWANLLLSISAAAMALRGDFYFDTSLGVAFSTAWVFFLVFALTSTLRVIFVFLVIVRGQQRMSRRQGRR